MSIDLPKDAEGREIPLDTKTLYTADGTQCDVSHFTYYPKCKITEQSWHIVFTSGSIKRASRMYLTPPDSWEKLEDDLDRVAENKDAFYTKACAYMNQGGDTCNDCRLYGHNTSSCTDKMFKDVVSRIRKLRGEDE